MTHSDLLLLASRPEMLRHRLTPDEALSLVAAHERLLEERDALRSERIAPGKDDDGTPYASAASWRAAHRDSQERAEAAESGLVRMSERVQAAESSLSRLRERVAVAANRARNESHSALGPEARCLLAEIALDLDMAIRSLVSESAPTNDKEKTR